MHMEKVTIYNTEGKKAGDITLPEAVFNHAWNPDVVHEVVLALQSNARANTAHTKDRSEVRGGGKKPWRQKGTGRARHGSRRSPIWTGGGVTFGPRNERNYTKKINKKMRAKALGMTLTQKLADNEILFLDALSFTEPKTSMARTILGSLASIEGKEGLVSKKQNAALIVLPGRDEHVERSFRNFGNVSVVQVKDLNTLDLLTFKEVIVVKPDTSLQVLSERITETPKEAVATA